MKRLLMTLALAVAVLLGGAAPAAADVDDFTFDRFHAEYTLTVDEEGRSQLHTVETLVAVFPDFDQNHGIRRLLVDDYDGHPTDIEVLSVEDERGNPRSYETDGEDGFLSVVIAADDYVHGEQTYVITYTQRNVTRFFADTGADEFYWDTNGTAWGQSFGEVVAEVNLHPDLQARLTGQVDAASGVEGANGPAQISETENGFVFRAEDLGPGENLTFAIGFEPGTFVPRDDGFFAAPWPSLALGSSLLGLVVFAWAVVTRRTMLRDAPGRGIVVAQYTPPTDANLLLSSVLIGRTGKATVAQILKLAVAGNLRVLEVEGRGKQHYRLQFLHADGTDGDDREFLHALFGNSLDPLETRDLKSADEKAASRISTLMKRVATRATAEGYRRRLPAGRIALLILLAILTATASLIFAAVALDQAYGGWAPALFLAVGIAAGIGSVVMVARYPLERKGVDVRDHLTGLRQYIDWAEEARLRYLQSPAGAQRSNVVGEVNPNDRVQLLKLNERLLPSAVLFGQEKQWSAELARYYEETGTEPSWYVGRHGFNAALFANSMSSMATSTASTFSSSSGGSAGGASSGGGGGGGGGGGVF